ACAPRASRSASRGPGATSRTGAPSDRARAATRASSPASARATSGRARPSRRCSNASEPISASSACSRLTGPPLVPWLRTLADIVTGQHEQASFGERGLATRSSSGASLRFARRGSIVSVLRREQTVADQREDRVRAVVDQDRHVGLLALGERVEHPVRRLLAPGRTTDAEPDPEEVGRSERLLQRTQTVVARRRTADLDPERAEGQVDLVVYRDHVIGLDVLLACERGDRGTALVHECARLGEQDAFGPHADLRDVGADEAGLTEAFALARGELVDDAVAEVVTGLRVGLAGVAEPRDEPGHGGEGV